jgi:hypothetical protein
MRVAFTIYRVVAGTEVSSCHIKRVTPPMPRGSWRFLVCVLIVGALVGISLLTLAAASGPTAARDLTPPAPDWTQLSDQQRTILDPLKAEWNQLPDYQRQRLLSAARAYPLLGSSQQQRFSGRLQQWSHLSLEERNLARKRYQEWSALTPSERSEIEHRWFQWAAANHALTPTKEPER